MPFTIAAGSEGSASLVITLRNRQTQTAMYVRNVPLRLLGNTTAPVTLWIALYTAGDPRNQSFPEDGGAPPRPETPQLQVSMRRVRSAQPADDLGGGSGSRGVAGQGYLLQGVPHAARPSVGPAGGLGVNIRGLMSPPATCAKDPLAKTE